MKPPEPEITNRYGLPFGRSRNTATYRSGRKWRDYYRWVCLRCGWAFCSPRHRSHRLADCDLVLLQLVNGDSAMRAYVRRNLFGSRPRVDRSCKSP